MLSQVRIFRSRLESLPCFMILLGILNGFSAVYFLGMDLTAGAVCFWSVPGILCAWLILGLRNSCCRFIPATVLAILSSMILISHEKESFHVQEMANHRRLGASAVFRLTESSLCGGTPRWIANVPYFTQAELQEVTFGGTVRKGPYSETVLMTVPSNSRDAMEVGYGDIISAEGYFERITEPDLCGTFDFQAYARARGAVLVFHAESVKILHRDNGLMRKLYDWRSRFLERLTARMPDGTAGKMAPALLFGIRQPIKGEIKQNFLESGTLHVLSVSGFHIGLFFTAVMLFLCFLPYRFRWLIAPVPVLIYALSTGMQAPAFRAFLMLSFWCLAHVFLRKNRGGNTLAAAAGVILLLNPFQLFDIGFLYSFLCVLFLILSSDFFRRISLAITVREEFYPDRRMISFSRILGYMTVLTGVSLGAWLCSMAISMSFQSFVSLWAVPAYLLMLPVTWFCFLLFLPAVLLQWIPGSVEWIGELIAPALEFCAFSAEQFGDSGAFYVSPPPLWLGILFLIALAGCFVFRRKWYFAGSAVLVFLTGFFLFFPLSGTDPEIAVIRSEASRIPAVVFSIPASGRAILWNVPEGETARLLSDYLRTSGIRSVEEMHFDSARSEICGGGLFLSAVTDVKSVYFHVPVRRNAKSAQSLLKQFPPPPGKSVLQWSKTESGVEVRPGVAGMEETVVRMFVSEDKGVILEVRHCGELLFRKEYLPGNEPVLERIKLPPRKKAGF
ncbi:MAG: ComEC/Rec2 family competence protein [Lentisphaeria bacterium]|nr:ComEC/Rec2 family competence protein [Lentisphaeria bacterium]